MGWAQGKSGWGRKYNNNTLTQSRHPLNEPCVLFPEIDGVRILTNSTCEFMHRVSSELTRTVFCFSWSLSFFPIASSLAVLRIGSMESGALLNDAYKEFEVSEDIPNL